VAQKHICRYFLAIPIEFDDRQPVLKLKKNEIKLTNYAL
jgi:hypothetical protein